MAPQIPLPFTKSFSEDSINGKKTKSTEFQLVETKLDEYVQISSRENLLALTKALGDWKLGVKKKNSERHWTSSARVDAVRKLDAWLIKESEAIGIFPTSRTLWGHVHNCYAYAMKCQIPDGMGQNSWPGKYAGIGNKGDFPEGVVNDGNAQNKIITVLPQTLPTPVPPRLTDNTYLVAIVANAMGYHFMRRRESTGLWTHKNGAASAVETYFYDTELEQPVAITDEVVAKILKNPGLIGCSMDFCRYFKVPVEGIQVKG